MFIFLNFTYDFIFSCSRKIKFIFFKYNHLKDKNSKIPFFKLNVHININKLYSHKGGERLTIIWQREKE